MNKKQLLFFIASFFLLLTSGKVNGQCPTGDVQLSSQEDVDNFIINYPNCTEIQGGLYISGSDITNLEGLSNLVTIEGSFYINGNFNLTNLDEPSNLVNIGVNLVIQFNPELINVDGLNALTNIGGTLVITNNNSLTNLDGLSNLVTIDGDLGIESNPVLNNISGLENINPDSISGSFFGVGLHIVGNPLLSVCNLDNFCEYLSNENNLRNINNNLDNCVNVQAVIAACNPPLECPTGNIQLSSQEDVDNFIINYPNCTEIQGNLIINGSDITNLDGLSNLVNIDGGLTIEYNTNLTNLNGLNALTNIEVGFMIQNNPELINVDGLNNLTNIGGTLVIYYNNNLTNLDGLSNLVTIDGDLVIDSNFVLNDISGLENINPDSILSIFFGVGLYIANNPLLSVCNLDNFCEYLSNENNLRNINYNLDNCLNEQAVIDACNPPLECPTGDIGLYSQEDVDNFIINYPNCTEIQGGLYIGGSGSDIINLEGLNNLTNIGGILNIYNNTNLANLDGLNNLVIVGGDIFIDTNPELTNIDGLNNLIHINGELFIFYNATLTNLDGLSNLTTIDGNLTIESNPELSNVDGLSNLVNIEGRLVIYDNATLTNLDGLSSLAIVRGELIIEYNPELTNVDGLNALINIEGALVIAFNDKLTNLDGLSNLVTIDGDLGIGYNLVLEDISGLENINPDSISGNTFGLLITDNPLLSVCNLDNLCEYLSNEDNLRNIHSNLDNCLNEQAVIAACEATSSIVDFEFENIVFYPNPFSDYLYIENQENTIEKIEVYDISGRLVKSEKTENLNEYRLNGESLPSGIYFIKAYSDKTEKMFKAIKK